MKQVGPLQSLACNPSFFSPHQCALHLHNTNRSIKESQILLVFISFISKRFFILSYPGHHVACFCALSSESSAVLFFAMLELECVVVFKRGHMNVRCRLRRRRLNLFSNEAGQKQVALPIVVRTRSKWTYVVH